VRARAEAGDRVGIEHEFVVRDRGRAIDFRRVIHRLAIDGVRADPADSNAYRCAWGGVITADGNEAEIAIPPVRVGPGFVGRASGLAVAGRHALERRLPAAHDLVGFSTHVSVALRARRDDRLSRRFARTFAPALMLLMDRRDSPGMLVRPRPGRMELCGEYVDGGTRRAVTAFAVGSVRALTGDRRAVAALRIDARLASAHERYGWYVDRNAFGVDLYAEGRRARLRRGRHGTITGQEHLERAWDLARAALGSVASSADLESADRLVSGAMALPSEVSHEERADMRVAG
jgi:hypothetical protein